MKSENLILTNGRKVRILWSLNAVLAFTKLTGIEMGELSERKLGVNELRTIAWCSAVEGEAAEGKELELTEVEFGRLMSMENIVSFTKILSEQSGNRGQKESAVMKHKKIFFRSWGMMR